MRLTYVRDAYYLFYVISTNVKSTLRKIYWIFLLKCNMLYVIYFIGSIRKPESCKYITVLVIRIYYIPNTIKVICN